MNEQVSKPVLKTGLIINKPGRTLHSRLLYTRYFFVVMGVFFIIVAAFGFLPSYKALTAGTMPFHWLVHVHGAVLSLWLIVFVIQAILAATGRIRFHRQLGQFSVLLGVLVSISMAVTIFHAHIGYPVRNGIAWGVVLLLSLIMSLFIFFFTWAIRVRKNPAAHKRLLFMATMVLISAGLNRILFHAGLDPTINLSFFPVIAKPSLLGVPGLSDFCCTMTCC